MKQKTRFKNFGNIGIGLKKAISVDLYFQFSNFTEVPYFPFDTFGVNVCQSTCLGKTYMVSSYMLILQQSWQ